MGKPSVCNDPIVREVRNIRLDIERECGPGPDAYYRPLLLMQNELKDRLVCREYPESSRVVPKGAGIEAPYAMDEILMRGTRGFMWGK
uniref:Uncharacterized protein n=1 Tax=Candidatus Kentrum sp. DK TaxID=2126562 RepID=A0A450TFL9_9GAMM|nr:MAG: hypothetical protein BECKDK2373C_GA0170839_113812 [Candidatus Kentron sp. DK]